MIEEMIENAIGEYFRGGSSYEDSVKNQLNALEATGIATSLAVSNMNSGLADAINSTTNELQGLRSDFQSAAVGLYNQGQSIRQDIQTQTNAIQGMAMGLTSAIHESTYEIVASQQMLADSFRHGFNSVNNTLDLGFSLVGNKLDVLSEEISSKLDEIHDILNNPRLTESRELYRQALICYQRKYYEDALKYCKEAVEKNTTDYISWYLLGMIYLFGASKFAYVIDLDKAEESFFNAAKYIDYDIGHSKEANLYASEIYYYLGQARLAKSNDYLIENKIDDSNSKLFEAENASSTAFKLSSNNLLARYEQAKELHFFGKDDESLKLIEELILKEKNFAIKAINDKNFKTLWDKIKKLILKLRDNLANKITQKSNNFRNLHNPNIEKLKNNLSKVEIPDETKIYEFEDFYNREFKDKNSSYAYPCFCDDFNNLAKELLIQNRFNLSFSKYQDVSDCYALIKNLRKGKGGLQSKLDTINSLINSVLSPFEYLKEKDYFYVLQKDIEFDGEWNKNKLKQTSSEISELINKFYFELETLDYDIKNLNFYLDVKKDWEKTTLKLRDIRINEISNVLNLVTTYWNEQIESIRKSLLDIHFPKENEVNVFEKFYYSKLKCNSYKCKSFNSKLSILPTYKNVEDCENVIENVRNGKHFVIAELDVLISRIPDVIKSFESLESKDYYFVSDKYNKLCTGYLRNNSSYFEYSISELTKEVEILKNDVIYMQSYIDNMRGKIK